MTARLILMTKQLLFSLAITLSCQAAEWEKLPPLPEPNGGFMCGVTHGKIVIIGGTNWEGGRKNWLKGVRTFDPSNMKWSKGKDLESPLAYGAVFHGEDRYAILGGFNGVNAAKQFAWGDPSAVELHTVFDQPEALVLAAGGAVGEMLVVTGGTNDPANVAGISRSTYLLKWGGASLAQIFSGRRYAEANIRPLFSATVKFEIIKMLDYPSKPFISAGSAVVGDELCVFGGLNWDETKQEIENTTAAYAFSPAKNAWRALQPLATPVRGLTAVALDAQHLYLAGGYAEAFRTEAFIYDVKTDSYTPAQPLPYAAMVSLVVCDGFVYCLGGEDKMKSRTDKFFRIPVVELLK